MQTSPTPDGMRKDATAVQRTARVDRIRVVIGEDDDAAAGAIGGALASTLPGCHIVSLVDRLEDARRVLLEAYPDVLVLDLDLHGSRGLDSYLALRDVAGDAVVLVVVGSGGRDLGLEAVACGADDYLVKDRAGLDQIGHAVLVALARRRAAIGDRRTAEGWRLEVVARLGLGISHHFNNLTQIVMGHAMLLLDTAEPSREVRDGLEVILRASQRSALLTRHLLEFTSGGSAPPELVNAAEVVRGMLGRVRDMIPMTVELEAGLDDRPCWVRISRLELEQIVLALTSNACDAMPVEGRFTLTVMRFETATGARTDRASGSMPGHVVLTASDTGPGMPEEVRCHVLEPFFTTKEVGRGAGLGLSAVHGVVKSAGGYIALSSSPGRGTTVRIHLPRQRPPTG